MKKIDVESIFKNEMPDRGGTPGFINEAMGIKNKKVCDRYRQAFIKYFPNLPSAKINPIAFLWFAKEARFKNAFFIRKLARFIKEYWPETQESFIDRGIFIRETTQNQKKIFSLAWVAKTSPMLLEKEWWIYNEILWNFSPVTSFRDIEKCLRMGKPGDIDRLLVNFAAYQKMYTSRRFQYWLRRWRGAMKKISSTQRQLLDYYATGELRD